MTIDKSLLSKQNQVINICYDRLLDILSETTNETTIIKCIEIIRKDMNAAFPQGNAKNSAINDTHQRVAEIENILKKL